MSDHLKVPRKTFVEIVACLEGLTNLALASRPILPAHMGENFVNLVCKAREATDSIEREGESHGTLCV